MIKNLAELRETPDGYVWAFCSWDGYSVWYWSGDGLQEQSPTDMASWYRASEIPESMFPMYTIPQPPDKPETVDALPVMGYITDDEFNTPPKTPRVPIDFLEFEPVLTSDQIKDYEDHAGERYRQWSGNLTAALDYREKLTRLIEELEQR